MCGGKAPKDNSAQLEAERQARIRAGTAKIDDTFAQFNDEFYNNRSNAYKDFYLPELDRQYKAAQDSLINSLGGNINGSEGAKAIGNLTKQYEAEKARLIQAALDQATEARLGTQNQRSQLISQLEGGGSVDNAAAMASTYAGNLARARTFSPLADLFSSATQQYANASNASTAGFAPVDTSISGLFNTRGSRTAQRQVMS